MSVVTAEPTTPTAGSVPGQRTVLVVEDEPTVRETVAEALAADGLRVITASDGRQALDRFRAERPDLVLLDLMLPELSGMEVCRILRRESSVPSSCSRHATRRSTRWSASRWARTTT